MHRASIRSLVLCAGLALSACGGSSRGAVVRGPAEFPGFPEQSQTEALWAEATLQTNHADLFDADLTRAGILPIEVRVGTRGGESWTCRLSEATFNPHLYLQDGTVLDWISADDVQKRHKRAAHRVAERALKLSLVESWSDAQTGFIFFSYDPEQVEIDGDRAFTRRGEVWRQIELPDSLVAFSVETNMGTKDIFVGLRTGRLAEDR